MTFDPERHCGAATRHDKVPNPAVPCQRPKGWGTVHPGTGNCKLHTGSVPNGIMHAATEGATKALARLGQPIATNPQQALLNLVSEAAGNVAFLREQAAGFGVFLTIKAGEVAVRPSSGDVEHDGELEDYRGHVVTIREDIRAMVKLYGEWCDRLANYAKEAIKAGIAEREIALVEAQADLVARVIIRALEGLPDAEFERRKADAMDELVRVKVLPGSRN